MKSIRSRFICGLLLMSYLSLQVSPSFAAGDDDEKTSSNDSWFSVDKEALKEGGIAAVCVAAGGAGLAYAGSRLWNYLADVFESQEAKNKRLNKIDKVMKPFGKEKFISSLSQEQQARIKAEAKTMVNDWPKPIKAKFEAESDSEKVNEYSKSISISISSLISDEDEKLNLTSESDKGSDSEDDSGLNDDSEK